MVQINFAQKQVNAKIVYYGPGMSGKTTNLEVIHQRAPQGNRGDLTSISTDGDRTLFFDFMPLDLGTVAGMRTCFQIYTVPGQVYYNSTRKLVLQGVDGVVFVADSSASMVEENLESFRNLEENLADYGKSLSTLPHIIQWNKRDLPDAMSVDELNQVLNKYNVPTYEAVANSGQGVFPTLKALAARVLESIHSGAGGAGGGAPKAAPAMPTTPAPTLPPPVASEAPVAQQPAAQAMPPAAPPVAQPAPQPMAQPAAQMPQQPHAPVQQAGAPQNLGQTGFQQPAQGQPQAQPALGQTGFAQAGGLRMVGENQGAAAYVPPPTQPAAQPMQQAPQMPPPAQQQAFPAAGMQQTGFHAAPATQTPSLAPAQPSGAAEMMRRQDVAPQAAQAAPARRPAARPPTNLEGTRFRPRQTRPTPRATPAKKRGNGMYTALFVVLALAVAGVVGKVVLTFF